MESNLTKSVREKPIYLKQLFENYSNSLSDYYQIEDEIPWDMLNSLSYVNSISSTTGIPARALLTLPPKSLPTFSYM